MELANQKTEKNILGWRLSEFGGLEDHSYEISESVVALVSLMMMGQRACDTYDVINHTLSSSYMCIHKYVVMII